MTAAGLAAFVYVATCFVEVPIYVLLLRAWSTPPRAALFGVLANAITLPIVLLGLRGLPDSIGGYVFSFLACEFLAYLVEVGLLAAWLHRVRIGVLRLGLIAAAPNVLSAFVGVVLWVRPG